MANNDFSVFTVGVVVCRAARTLAPTLSAALKRPASSLIFSGNCLVISAAKPDRLCSKWPTYRTHAKLMHQAMKPSLLMLSQINEFDPALISYHPSNYGAGYV